MHATGNAPASVPFVTALKWWLRLGCISFGGPAGQIAIMHRELVEKRRWISESRFLHALNFCMVLPGPEAQQLATYIGWLMHGVRGGIADSESQAAMAAAIVGDVRAHGSGSVSCHRRRRARPGLVDALGTG